MSDFSRWAEAVRVICLNFFHSTSQCVSIATSALEKSISHPAANPDKRRRLTHWKSLLHTKSRKCEFCLILTGEARKYSLYFSVKLRSHCWISLHEVTPALAVARPVKLHNVALSEWYHSGAVLSCLFRERTTVQKRPIWALFVVHHALRLREWGVRLWFVEQFAPISDDGCWIFSSRAQDSFAYTIFRSFCRVF